jgi:uncharacterized protein
VRLVLAVLLGLSLAAIAQIAVPPVARVTDQTGTLSAEQKAGLERMLQAFEARKGSQIAVLMVPTTGGEPIEQYALRVAEQWKLGRKGVDDGALLAIAKDDRALRIEVGYGLEGALNDATAKRIIAEVITPRFREGDFFGGVSAGVDRMIKVIDGEPLPAPAKSAPQMDGGVFQFLPIVLIVAMVIGGLLRALLGRALGAMATGGAVGILGWLLAGTLFIGVIAGLLAFFFTLVGGFRGGLPGGGFGHRGGWGGGGWGGGGIRTGGGGGFGGGGGSFGGGGASGRW